jgi:hypothetical protein
MKAGNLDSSAADFLPQQRALFGYAGDLPQDQFAMCRVLARRMRISSAPCSMNRCARVLRLDGGWRVEYLSGAESRMWRKEADSLRCDICSAMEWNEGERSWQRKRLS